MLAFLAATIPILGALYAAGSYLVEQQRLDHEHRVRLRLMPRREEQFQRLLRVEQARAERMGVRFDMDLFMHRINETDEMLYRANGVDPLPSHRKQALNAAMSAPLVPKVERRRQWILLTSSVIGVILLAMDAMPGD